MIGLGGGDGGGGVAHPRRTRSIHEHVFIYTCINCYLFVANSGPYP